MLSYHLSPMTCGVAKFNATLAGLLGVPMLGLFDPAAGELACPLLSLKLSELLPADVERLAGWLAARGQRPYRVFLHDLVGDDGLERQLWREAERVYCGNSELGRRLGAERADVVTLWCPGTLLETAPLPAAEISVFSFGMSHKVRLDCYAELARLLDATGRSFSLLLSTALHDNSSFDGAFTRLLGELRSIFDDRLCFLGFLSDRAIRHQLEAATFFAAFFQRGVRANNTSVHTAMQYGAAVITNLDEHSPPELAHLETVIDIRQARELPTDEATLATLRRRSVAVAAAYGWEPLLARIRQSTADHQP